MSTSIPKGKGNIYLNEQSKIQEVMYAEDSSVLRRQLIHAFKNFSADLTVASSGEEALEIIKLDSSRFKVFILDQEMGDKKINGTELAYKIREKLGKSVKIFQYSSNKEINSVSSPLGPFDARFQKSTEKSKLVNTVKEIISSSGMKYTDISRPLNERAEKPSETKHKWFHNLLKRLSNFGGKIPRELDESKLDREVVKK